MKNWTARQRREAFIRYKAAAFSDAFYWATTSNSVHTWYSCQGCRGPISVVAPADCEGWQATCLAIEILQVGNGLGSCSCTKRTFLRCQSCPWPFITVLPRTDLDLFRNAVLAIALPAIALFGSRATHPSIKKSITEICGHRPLPSVSYA